MGMVRRIVAQRGRALTAVALALLVVTVGIAARYTLFAGVDTGSRDKPLPTIPLSWRQAALPPGVTASLLADANSQPFAAAPSNGDTAYACLPPRANDGHPRAGVHGDQTAVWVTRDRAMHWRQVSSLPASAAGADGCSLLVDDLNPARVVIMLAMPSTAAGLSVSVPPFASHDGGETWQMMPGMDEHDIGQFVTWKSVVYATVCCYPGGTTGWRLMASQDGMQTWQAIDAPMVAMGEGVMQFWLNPRNGEVLAKGWNIHDDGRKLWLSRDGGQHWAKLHVPNIQMYGAQPGSDGRGWRICGEEATSSADLPTHPLPIVRIACSMDEGTTWTARPLLSPETAPLRPTPAPLPPTAQETWFIAVEAMTTTGDLLLSDDRPNIQSLYRLAANGERWQALGDVPMVKVYSRILYSSGPDAGVLWILPSYSANGTHGLDGPLLIFAASYPADGI